MPVKMRLSRAGGKKSPYYHVVVADARMPRDGRSLDAVGRYDPRLEPSLIEIDADKAKMWLERGAQPTAPVQKLLEIAGVVPAKPKPARSKRALEKAKAQAQAHAAAKKAEAAEAAAAAAPAAAPAEAAAEEPPAEAAETPEAAAESTEAPEGPAEETPAEPES